MNILLIIVAVLFPPLAVLLKRGVGKELLLNVILTLCVFFPGMIHAIWLVTQKSD